MKTTRKKKSLATSTSMKRKSSKKVAAIQSTPSGIFKLNPDCLAEVFRYLPLKQVSEIIQIDDRFRSAARIRFCYGGVEVIDKEFLNDYPPDIREDYYKAYGPGASTMTFKCLAGSDFINAIRHFQNLTILILRKVSISKDSANNVELPRSLEGLGIDLCEISDNVLRQWFVQINPTLRDLAIVLRSDEKSKFGCVKKLTKLLKIKIDGVLPEVALGNLIEQNKNHLQSLSLGSDVTKPNYGTDTWKNISKLQHLNELTLWNYEMPGLARRPSRPSLWPGLESITLAMDNPSTFIANLGCQQTLKSIRLVNFGTGENVNLRPLAQFPKLRTLDLSGRNWVQPYARSSLIVSQMIIFQQIRTLILNSGSLRKSDDIVKLAVKMPNLKVLLMKEIDIFFCGDIDKLKATLKRRRPTLRFKLSLSTKRRFGRAI